MKARVKATGEIVEVHTSDDADFVDRNGKYYWENDLFFGSLDVSSYDDPDYWTRLEHQYVGMAMQGLISCKETLLQLGNARDMSTEEATASAAYNIAHALVKKMKEERK